MDPGGGFASDPAAIAAQNAKGRLDITHNTRRRGRAGPLRREPP